jgi:hypothetical protein
VHLTVFFESDLGRDFPEALPAEVQAVLAYVGCGLAASPASLYASAELSLPGNIIFQELGLLCRLVLYLVLHLGIMSGCDFPSPPILLEVLPRLS